MKFVEIDELLDKIPNRYLAIIMVSKEARKIIGERKPPAPPKETEEAEIKLATVTPEIQAEPVERGPKKRGRKPKKPGLENIETEKKIIKIDVATESIAETVNIDETSVSAEKIEENPYIDAVKRLLARFAITSTRRESKTK